MWVASSEEVFDDDCLELCRAHVPLAFPRFMATNGRVSPTKQSNSLGDRESTQMNSHQFDELTHCLNCSSDRLETVTKRRSPRDGHQETVTKKGERPLGQTRVPTRVRPGSTRM